VREYKNEFCVENDMAKKKEKKMKMAFFSDEEPERMESWGKANKKVKAEREAAYRKKKRKEKKERKAKILAKDEAKREVGKIALNKLKDARQAIKEYDKMPFIVNGKIRKAKLFDSSREASDIKKEFLKLEKEVKLFFVLRKSKK